MSISIYKTPKKTFTVIDPGVEAAVAVVKNSRVKAGSGKGTFRVYAGDRIEDFPRRMDALRWAYAQVVGIR